MSIGYRRDEILKLPMWESMHPLSAAEMLLCYVVALNNSKFLPQRSVSTILELQLLYLIRAGSIYCSQPRSVVLYPCLICSPIPGYKKPQSNRINKP